MSQTSPLEPGALVDRLPLFPLPNLVFFPSTLVPLHVFEPRYMAMVSDAWRGDRLIGLVQLASGWEEDYYGAPRVHRVLGIGQMVHKQDAPDSRANILLRGLTRARILDEHCTDRMYRMVRAEAVGSDASDASGVARRLATVRHLFAGLLAAVDGADMTHAEALFAPEADASVVIDAIASALPISGAHKQALLAELDVVERADRLTALLAEFTSDPELTRSLTAR